MKGTIFAVSVFAAVLLNAATIDRMVVRQQWPWNGKVRVEYILSGAAAPQDVAVAISQGGQAVDVSGADRFTFLVGDLHGVVDGAHSFTIDADQLPSSVRRDADVTVSLSLSDSPANINDAVYMIVDMVNASNVTYVTRADLLDGKYGTYETSYSAIRSGFNTPIPASDVIIWTGVTNDVKYMTTHMVLRKIPVANEVFTIGVTNGWLTKAGNHRDDIRKVKLTSDFWMGVFEVTQSQYARMGVAATTHHFTNPTCAASRPAENVTYEKVRGSSLGAQWVQGATIGVARQVDKGTWLDVFRSRSGLERLDLPSSAQWEIACMAKNTTTHLYSGEDYARTSFSSLSKDTNLDKLARYKWNGGYDDKQGSSETPAVDPDADCDTSRGTAKVGTYAPNAYGLYDMLGNVSEWTLDYIDEDPTSVNILVNPYGGTKEENGRRARRGGAWSDPIGALVNRCSPAPNYASQVSNYIGIRVCYTEHDDEASEEEDVQ